MKIRINCTYSTYRSREASADWISQRLSSPSRFCKGVSHFRFEHDFQLFPVYFWLQNLTWFFQWLSFNTLRKNLGGGILLYSSHLRWLWLIHSYLVLELNFSLISQAELSQIELYGPSFEDRLRANDWSTRDWLTFRIVIFYLEQIKIFQKVETINIKIFKIKYIDGKSF